MTAVTRNRIRLFEDFDRGCVAARTLACPEHWQDSSLLAWVLMPDHMHLLMELGETETLSGVVRRVKAAISTALRVELVVRQPWQSGFHDHALRSGESVRAAARYLVANPVRARLVKRVGDYPFWDAVWIGAGGNPLDP